MASEIARPGIIIQVDRAQSMLTNCRKLRVTKQVECLAIAEQYEIFDLDTREVIGSAREIVSNWVVFLRGVLSQMLPTNINAILPTMIVVKDNDSSKPFLKIKRSFSLLQSNIQVINQQRKPIGYFKSKLFSWGGGFTIHDPSGDQIADVKACWQGLGLDYRLSDMDGKELGVVRRIGSWSSGFKAGDEYVISLTQNLGKNRNLASLVLAAGLAIDIVYRSRGQEFLADHNRL